MSKFDEQTAVESDRHSRAATSTIVVEKPKEQGTPKMWEKPSYEIISAGAEVTGYIHKR